MSEHSKHGQFCWNECFTHDFETVRAFYQEVFNWDQHDLATTVTEYLIFTKAKEHLASARRAEDDEPAHWLSYIRVDDIEAMVSKALALKATLHTPITLVPNIGRFAILYDVTGVKFALWDTNYAKEIDDTELTLLTDPGL